LEKCLPLIHPTLLTGLPKEEDEAFVAEVKAVEEDHN